MSLKKTLQTSPYIIKGEKKNMHCVHVAYHQTNHFVMAATRNSDKINKEIIK